MSLQVTAQLTERVLLYEQFGQNDFTSSYGMGTGSSLPSSMMPSVSTV